MRVEFIGYIEAASRHTGPPDRVFDLGYIREVTQMHERLGYDSVLVGYGPDSPDSLQLAAYAAAQSDHIRMLVAHRGGIIFPTLAARMFASLDHFTGGRISVNLVSGGTSEADARREGDFLPKDLRYARAGEYLQVLKAAWTASAPFSHSGAHYRFEDYEPRVRPLQLPWIPLYVAGSSPPARVVAGQFADKHAFYGEPLAGTASLIDSVKQIAESAGRATPPEFVARLTVIPAATDSLAWDRAYSYLERAGGLSDGSHLQPPVSEGERRIRAAAAEEERHDLAMWTVVGRNWGATLNALVGSPATITQALLEYVRLGVTGFRIHVFDYMTDTDFVGRELIPLVRAGAAAITPP